MTTNGNDTGAWVGDGNFPLPRPSRTVAPQPQYIPTDIYPKYLANESPAGTPIGIANGTAEPGETYSIQLYPTERSSEIVDLERLAKVQTTAMLEEREQKMQALSALAGMLYLFYKQQIQDKLLEFEPVPEPPILKEVRTIVDKNFAYYQNKNAQEYCDIFEKIVGNGKENFIPKHVTGTLDDLE